MPGRPPYNAGVGEPLAPRSSQAPVLGPLERRVLEALWAREDAVTVRQLMADFPTPPTPRS